jgi:CelD/BcsL family acetyltransferase involved in cellulose biosynthesis
MLVILAAVEDAFARQDRRFDFGAGESPYKSRFADADAPITWVSFVPPGRRQALGRVRLAREGYARAARRQARRLPNPVQRVIRERSLRTSR